MAPTIVGGSAAPKLVMPYGAYDCPDPTKFTQNFKEIKIEQPLIDGEIKKHVEGYRYLAEIEWECINEENTDDLGQIIETLNYLKNADNRTIYLYPHSDNDFWVLVMLDGDFSFKGIGEKEKESGHSLKLKFVGKKLLAALPFGWVSPTGYSDPNFGWNNEWKAYDELVGYYADSNNINASSWSEYLFLTHPSTLANKLRFYASGTDISEVDVDVYADDITAVWKDVYQGAFNQNEWVEKDFSAHSGLNAYHISQIRIRFYNSGSVQRKAYLKEIDFGVF